MPLHRSLPLWLVFFALMAPLAAADSAGPGATASSAPQPAVAPTAVSPSAAPAAPPAAATPAIPAAGSDLPPKPAEDDAVRAEIAARATPKLKELVARQDTLLAELGNDEVDQDNVKRDIQNLIFDYDAFLRVFPRFAPGYVPYGLLLGKVGMRRESAAIRKSRSSRTSSATTWPRKANRSRLRIISSRPPAWRRTSRSTISSWASC